MNTNYITYANHSQSIAYMPNCSCLEALNEESLKIQYIVKKVYQKYISTKIQESFNEQKISIDQIATIENFNLIFNYCAPYADNFCSMYTDGHSNMYNYNVHKANTLSHAFYSAILLFAIGSIYSWFMGGNSFEITSITTTLVPGMILVYGLLTGK